MFNSISCFVEDYIDDSMFFQLPFVIVNALLTLFVGLVVGQFVGSVVVSGFDIYNVLSVEAFLAVGIVIFFIIDLLMLYRIANLVSLYFILATVVFVFFSFLVRIDPVHRGLYL